MKQLDYAEFRDTLQEKVPKYFQKNTKLVIDDPYLYGKNKKETTPVQNIATLYDVYIEYCKDKKFKKPMKHLCMAVAINIERDLCRKQNSISFRKQKQENPDIQKEEENLLEK